MSATKLIVHPLHQQFADSWRMAMDVYEGSGGFLDEDRPYLIPHPREWLDHSVEERNEQNQVVRRVPNPKPTKPSPKLVMRRRLARYENVAEAILGSISGALFRQPATRTFARKQTDDVRGIQAWWKDLDGKSTDLNTWMFNTWTSAAVFGHMIALVDKPTEEATTRADQRPPILRTYTPLDLIDWLEDTNGKLIAVRLMEPAPRESFDDRIESTKKYRIREVNEEKWTLRDQAGTLIEEGEHKMGRLPVALLYGKRRTLVPLIGKSIMGDPMHYIDVYNLHSETRELLRNQTFAILNVPIGQDGNVEEEQSKIGSQGGTANVVFSSQPIDYVSPDGTNVEVYHEHTDRVVRSLYRLAATAWEGDSRDAESGDSLRIKSDQQTQVLRKYAAECQRFELELTELYFRAMEGADRWKAEMDREKVTIAYPETFSPPNLEDVVARAGEALGLDLGPTASKELKKRTARQMLPGLSQELTQTIDKEIDGQTIKSADEKQAELLKATAARFGRPPVDEGNGGDDPTQQDDAKGGAAA
jgi:hypothetical protein